MFSTYDDYQTMPGSLTFEEMADLHKQILDDAKLDADSAGLFKDVFAAAGDAVDGGVNGVFGFFDGLAVDGDESLFHEGADVFAAA